MKQSLSYYLTLLVIKIKGLKREFSKDPIDYKKIRKEDVHYPKGTFFKKNTIQTFTISDSLITEIGLKPKSEKLLIFIHGGAFISGPAKHHWDSIKQIAEQTDYKIWMCDYPKSPESKIKKISENIDNIYDKALKKYTSNNITFLGDSVGATLITCLTQRLIKKNTELPLKIILISPVMNASMSNPEVEIVDKIDPMLSKIGVVSAKKMCAENNDLKSEMISPLFGSFDKFPHTILFLAENDITYPDQKLALEKFNMAKINLEVIEGKNMPHIWPLLPVMKEAKTGLNKIIRTLNHERTIE